MAKKEKKNLSQPQPFTNNSVDNVIQNLNGTISAKVDADGHIKPPIIQQLTIRPIYRHNVDIETWRVANRAAEASVPRRVELYDLYTDCYIDGHLRSVVDKRIMGVTNANWAFVDKDGKEVQAIKDWIDTPDFELLLTEIVNSKLWGYSMLEFEFQEDGSISVFSVPKKHMRPKLGVVSFEQTANAGIYIREGVYADTILEVGDENDLGLLLSAAQYVIYKRGNFGDWANFIERFGQPLIDAQWDGYDEKQRLELLKALNEMGAGGQIVRPAGTQLTMQNGGANNPTGQLNDTFNNACNAELSKLILGQTETTQSSESSGYAQASVHAETENDINRTDLAFARRILNKRVIKMLQANGIFVEGTFVIQDANNSGLTLDQQLTMEISMVTQLNIPISDDHFYEKYGIEKPDNYDDLKASLLAKAAMQQQNDLGGSFNSAPTANGAKTSSLRNMYSRCNCGCQLPKSEVKLADSGIDDNFIKSVFNGELKNGQIHDAYYFNVGKKFTDAIVSGLGKITGIGNSKTSLFERLKDNVFAFSAAKSLTMAQQYKSQLSNPDGTTRSYSQFKSAVNPIDQEFNDNYQHTEYDSAVNMAQMANKWDNLQQHDYLEYRAVMDDRTRALHRKLDGVVLAKNDPLWNTIYPPNGWNCRCTVVPSTNNVSSNRDDAMLVAKSGAIPPYFRRNVGTEQTIFKDDHPYFQRTKNDTRSGQAHQFMAQENYAMRPAENIVKDGSLPEFTKAATIDDAKTAWDASDKKITTADGLDWDMSDQWQHIVHGNSDNRWQYINHAKDVLQNADEVWSTRDIRNGTSIYKRYVKYYKGQPVVFSYDINAPDKWTMYAAKVDETGGFTNLRNNIRRGVLVHKK